MGNKATSSKDIHSQVLPKLIARQNSNIDLIILKCERVGRRGSFLQQRHHFSRFQGQFLPGGEFDINSKPVADAFLSD